MQTMGILAILSIGHWASCISDTRGPPGWSIKIFIKWRDTVTTGTTQARADDVRQRGPAHSRETD